MPIRIQRRRTKGWQMPPGTVYVGRPSVWQNRWTIGVHSNFLSRVIETNADATACFAEMAWPDDHHRQFVRQNLRGKNLACWCGLCDRHKDGKPLGVECPDCQPCHADVLLELANEGG